MTDLQRIRLLFIGIIISNLVAIGAMMQTAYLKRHKPEPEIRYVSEKELMMIQLGERERKVGIR